MTAQIPLPQSLTQSAPVHSAGDLLGDSRVAYIALEDQVYTLRLTRAGKLLLTK
ncbi:MULTISPECIES: hemin uptake protein HemP [Nioella]|uniref:hemin uptake protein HemP n=1 Tax=Nioella TaxID=1775424 RepID=UPI000FD94D02|nr:hemin uptake protein HemP [Nioella ostreopsis]